MQGPMGALVEREFHFLQETAEPRVRLDVAQQRIALDTRKSAIALLIGSLEPLEGLVRLATVGMDLGNLECADVTILRRELALCSIRLILLARAMIGKSASVDL